MSTKQDKGSDLTLEMKLGEREREIESLKLDLAKRDEMIASLRDEVKNLRASAEAPRPVGEEAWVVKARLSHNGNRFMPGDEMPFDPKHPPHGCEGLIEGVHYERARVVRAKG